MDGLAKRENHKQRLGGASMIDHQPNDISKIMPTGLIVTRCVNCDSSLPTLCLGSGSSTRVWECQVCGATAQGVLCGNPPSHLRARLKLVDYFPDSAEAESMLPPYEPERELRRHERRPVTVTIQVTQLNDDMLPVDDDFTVVSRDLSESGVCLVHNEPLSGKLAALLELPRVGRVQIILSVVRCVRVGSVFEIGCRFIKRIR